jgi:hypothetical protein
MRHDYDCSRQHCGLEQCELEEVSVTGGVLGLKPKAAELIQCAQIHPPGEGCAQLSTLPLFLAKRNCGVDAARGQ